MKTTDILKETDEYGELNRFRQHAKEIGLKSDTKDKKTFALAFAMRDDRFFDIAFQYDPSHSTDKVKIEYVLGAGKHYNVTISLERFFSFDKNEAEALHKEIKSRANKYAAAVDVVKVMPAEVKDLIKTMVK